MGLTAEAVASPSTLDLQNGHVESAGPISLGYDKQPEIEDVNSEDKLVEENQTENGLVPVRAGEISLRVAK